MEKLRQNCDESAEFISKFKSGDPEAFNQFCDKYKTVIIMAVSRRCLKSEREDVVQESLMKCFRMKDKYNSDKSKLATWVSMIAKSVAMDLFRRKKCRPELATSPDDQKTEAKIDINILVRIKGLEFLDDSDIELLRFKYVEGMKYRHVSEATGLPEGTVRSKLYRATAKIRERISSAENAKVHSGD
jgi:RNA polymerase sigma-70 factor (ECF subfamily)